MGLGDALKTYGNLETFGLFGGNDSGQIDLGAQPTLPGFNQIYDPNTMSLGKEMQGLLADNPTKYSTAPLHEIEKNASDPNASPWAQLQSQLAHTQTNQAASQAAQQSAGSTAQAEGNLAMSGGLSSGAAERAQTAGQQAGTGAQQNVQNEGNQNQLKIGISDAANKQQERMALPGMEAQAYSTSLQPIQMQGQAAAQDMAAQMANNQALNQYDMGAFSNESSLYGAGQTANAQTDAAKHSGGLLGGGGFLGTGSWLCTERSKLRKLSQEEQKDLADLLRYARHNDRDLTKWYLKNGATLVTLMKAKGSEWIDENSAFIDMILKILKAGEMHQAFSLYRKHVYSLSERYWLPLAMRLA